MNNLSKDDFISAIESLQLQASKDIDHSNAINKVFSTDAYYDNSVVVLAVIKLLQVFFPKDENGFCEIEHYCFDLNFGKVSDQELITPEDLWNRLYLAKLNAAYNRHCLRPWALMKDADPNNPMLFRKYPQDSFDGEFTNRFLVDKAALWPSNIGKIFLTNNPSLKGLPLDLDKKEPIPSTHPLIDDYPKQETIFDIIARQKEDAQKILRQNCLYRCYSNDLFQEGKVSALEAIEKELKK